MNSFYTIEELQSLGLKSFGNNVMISRKCSIYGASNISLGNNVRIDDFCLLSGEIEIGNYVHISAYSALYGGGKIKIGNFCGISPRSTLLSASDDFSGLYMISPLVPENLTHVTKAQIVLNDYVQLGTNTIVLPGVILGEGAVTGACSLVKNNLRSWTINIGMPTKHYKDRSKHTKELSQQIKL